MVHIPPTEEDIAEVMGDNKKKKVVKKKAGRPRKKDLGECGLPSELIRDKTEIVSYLKRWDFTYEEWKTIVPSDYERKMYKLYKAEAGNRAGEIKYFVFALRLWKANYPLYPKKRPAIETMKIEAGESK